MKTIFRFVNIGLLLAAVIAAGAVAGLAQDPCADAEGKTALDAKFRALLPLKPLADRKAAVEAGKQFLEKYGACEDVKEFADYLKTNIPVLEKNIQKIEADTAKSALTTPFDAALKAKNYDEVYSYGKEILAKYPDEFRPVEIVLGSIGGEEALKANFKYNDDTLKYAKQSIADLEAGKPFVIGDKPRYGISLKGVYNFEYGNKDDALGWLNYYIGYIIQAGQKNKLAAAPYLYKATQSNSDTKNKPLPYEFIGSYYIDELNKQYDEIQALIKTQSETDTPEIAQPKVDAIKAKIAMANGTAERAMDAYARAANLTTDAAAKGRLKNTIQEIYKRRFDKTEGVDAWMASAVAKPFVNPTTPVAPISDPEPVAPATTAPATTTTPAKAPATTPAKPAATPPAKPAAGAKPQTSMKKPAAKKKKKV